MNLHPNQRKDLFHDNIAKHHDGSKFPCNCCGQNSSSEKRLGSTIRQDYVKNDKIAITSPSIDSPQSMGDSRDLSKNIPGGRLGDLSTDLVYCNAKVQAHQIVSQK